MQIIVDKASYIDISTIKGDGISLQVLGWKYESEEIQIE